MMSLLPKFQFLIIRVCDLCTLDDVLGMDIGELIFNEALRSRFPLKNLEQSCLNAWQCLCPWVKFGLMNFERE